MPRGWIVDKQELPPKPAARFAWLQRRRSSFHGQNADIERGRLEIEDKIRQNRDSHSSALRSATTPGLSHALEQLDIQHKNLLADMAANRVAYTELGKNAGAFNVFFNICLDIIRSNGFLLPGEHNSPTGPGIDAHNASIAGSGTTKI